VSSGGGKVLVVERSDWRVISAEGYCGWEGWLARREQCRRGSERSGEDECEGGVLVCVFGN
jgi:hypothetical protein